MPYSKKLLVATLPVLLTGIAAFIVAFTTPYATFNHYHKQIDPTKKIVSDLSKASVEEDKFQVISILPAIGTPISGQQNFEINLNVHYKLASAESALFVAHIEQFAYNDACATGIHQTIGGAIPARITIKRGEGDLTIKLFYKIGHDAYGGQQFVNGNHIAPNASLLAGFDGQNKAIIMQQNLWDFKDYCYPFQP